LTTPGLSRHLVSIYEASQKPCSKYKIEMSSIVGIIPILHKTVEQRNGVIQGSVLSPWLYCLGKLGVQCSMRWLLQDNKALLPQAFCHSELARDNSEVILSLIHKITENYMVNNSITADGDDPVYTSSLYSKTLRDNNISQEDWKHLLVSHQDKVTGSLDPTCTSSYMDDVHVAGKISSICTKLVVESMLYQFISGQQFNPSKRD